MFKEFSSSMEIEEKVLTGILCIMLEFIVTSHNEAKKQND